jgi:proline dehydrogenase
MMRDMFISLSNNEVAQKFVTHFPPAQKTAHRFVAGETLSAAVAVVKSLNQHGIKAVMNEVGESISTRAEAEAAASEFHTLLHRIKQEGLQASVSLKPSHLGLAFGLDFFYETVADIVAQAQKLGITVEMDMEGSGDVDLTLQCYHRLLDTFGGGVRLALQGYLHRTSADMAAIIERGGGVRLVKGAYAEPPSIALQDREAIREACRQLMLTFFTPQAQETGAYLALGSHDPVLIAWLLQTAADKKIPPERFEIQMLQGVRRDEQIRLAELGYQVRVYVPYGSAWYPYFMRRLAERPANVLFIARALFGG